MFSKSNHSDQTAILCIFCHVHHPEWWWKDYVLCIVHHLVSECGNRTVYSRDICYARCYQQHKIWCDYEHALYQCVWWQHTNIFLLKPCLQALFQCGVLPHNRPRPEQKPVSDDRLCWDCSLPLSLLTAQLISCSLTPDEHLYGIRSLISLGKLWRPLRDRKSVV